MESVPEFAFDALFYSSKKGPCRVAGKWGLSAAVTPATARVRALDLPPSAAAAILQFTAHESMRLMLPVSRTTSVAVDAVHAAWKTALLQATPAAAKGLLVPISPVEHENEQLRWGRRLPHCHFGDECDACRLPGAPAPLHVYLSVAEQDAFDARGTVPQAALFCLLCIRRDCQALYLAHYAVAGPTLATGRPTFCVPPFQNLIDCPGGYTKTSLGVPPQAMGLVPVSIVGVSGQLTVVRDAFSGNHHVDQGGIVYGARLNCRAAGP